MAAATASTPLYIQIAEGVIGQIESARLRPGEKVPSIRRLSQQERVSISTALQAYMWLKTAGIWKRRPKSGFFVRRPFASLIPEPRFETPRMLPHLLGTNDILAHAGSFSARSRMYSVRGRMRNTRTVFPTRDESDFCGRIVNRQPITQCAVMSFRRASSPCGGRSPGGLPTPDAGSRPKTSS